MQVVGLDNVCTGSPSNVTALEGDEFEFIEHDIARPIRIDGEIDGVLNCASPASPVDYLETPIQTLKVGSLGTHNCLGIALAKKGRFLIASTSEVYGNPQVHPQPETYGGHVPLGVRGCYDEAKRFAEAMTMA
jgi:dTDP-glucose 4,6-dehydratase